MSKYSVYGIGNALVDMEFEVDEKFLETAKIEKGLMTLVDEKRQEELLALLNNVKTKRGCGGSAANTMIAIAQLGGKSFYSCKVAGDETGDFYYKDLLANGVSTNLSDDRESGITGKCMVLITPDADRTMNSFLGITETFSENELREDKLSESEYLYIEGYLVTSDTGRAAAIKAREMAEKNNVKVALTFSDPGMVSFFKDGLEQMKGDNLDLLFCNEDEAMTYTGAKTVEEAAEKLKEVTKQFAVTLGPKGAILFDGDKLINISTQQVKAVDTNGAGDLFAGVFLYGITNGLSFEDAGKRACASSSTLVQEYGARLSTDKLQEVFKK